MKKIIIILFALLLCGCQNASTYDIQTNLDKNLSPLEQAVANKPNNVKPLFSYYSEPSVGVFQSNQTGNVLVNNGNKFVMNLNVSNIINQKYYQDVNSGGISVDSTTLVATRQGTYLDYEGQENEYLCNVYNIDGMYLVYLQNSYVDLYGIVDKLDTVSLAKTMLKIAKSVEVNENTVLATYSSKETVEYNKEALQLFEVVVPENGRLEEIMTNKTEVQEEEITEEQTGEETEEEGTVQSSNEPNIVEQDYSKPKETEKTD